MSIWFVGERLVTKIDQQRMVLPIEPTAEDSETAVLWPSIFIGQPSRQLLDEYLSAQLPQGLPDVAFCVTFGDKVDRRIFL
jgi:hypothetical protein